MYVLFGISIEVRILVRSLMRIFKGREWYKGLSGE